MLGGALLQAALITDDAGQKLNFDAPPQAVVSVVPAATETLSALELSEAVVGITYHDEYLGDMAHLPLVGGAFSPRFDLINPLNPDLVIINSSDLEKAKAARGDRDYTIMTWDSGGTLADGEKRIGWLGEIFNKGPEADKIINRNLETFELLANKTSHLPPEKKLRTMHLMFDDKGLMTAGDDSFQNEIIAAAGGIPPKFGPGYVNVTLEMWKDFNPEAVYYCGASRDVVQELLKKEGWKDVPVVENGKVYSFPCTLTCRAATHTGYFTHWLSSSLYTELYADKKLVVKPREIVAVRPIKLDLPYVKRARIVETRVMDIGLKTLLIDFTKPQTIISSESGQLEGIVTIGNSYSPAPAWGIFHQLGFDTIKTEFYKVLELDEKVTDLMYTGADMDTLALKTVSTKDLIVTALVTAGVDGNAVRSSRDTGAWYEGADETFDKNGTINIIVMTNHKLSPKAMARSFITITEAKTAALWDMDIRSTQTRLVNPATGTGTDSIIVVSGEGPLRHSTGGHSKMGELIAQAVYEGVQQAILNQGGKIPSRNIFHRLAERGLNLEQLFGNPNGMDPSLAPPTPREWEDILFDPHYVGFLTAAMSLSDAQIMGQVKDLDAFEAWALQIAGEIAGKPVTKLQNFTGRKKDIPPVLATALNALGTGLKMKDKATQKATK